MSYYPYAKPRKVTGGITARSTRGAIGESWWSRRFLAVLESFALGTRLTRGRRYARAGQVLTLDIAPGSVTATVQGSRPTPYRVSIGLPAFPDGTWSTVETRLAEQALYAARLLSGELPSELESVFAEAGAPLFPATVRELAMRCSCPDYEVPCKHLAATFYLLAEAFDADPFQLLHWRGRERATLLSHVSRLRDRGHDPDGPADAPAPAAPARPRGRRRSAAVGEAPAPVAPRVGAALALVDAAVPDVDLDRFWLPPVPLPPRPPILSTEPDLLLRQLPAPGPALGGPDLVTRLGLAYSRFAAPPEPPTA